MCLNPEALLSLPPRQPVTPRATIGPLTAVLYSVWYSSPSALYHRSPSLSGYSTEVAAVFCQFARFLLFTENLRILLGIVGRYGYLFVGVTLVSWYKNLSRRQFIQLAAAASAATGISCNRPLFNPWRFLSVAEARTLAAICDQLIPPDHDPGADWARVVNFIDIQLCGPYLRWQNTYRHGLAFLDRSSRAKFRQPFALLSADQQNLFLRSLESGELSPDVWNEIPPSAFFDLLLNHSMQGYYGDSRHGGNRDHASWKMVGLSYPQVRGQQHYEPQNS